MALVVLSTHAQKAQRYTKDIDGVSHKMYFKAKTSPNGRFYAESHVIMSVGHELNKSDYLVIFDHDKEIERINTNKLQEEIEGPLVHMFFSSDSKNLYFCGGKSSYVYNIGKKKLKQLFKGTSTKLHGLDIDKNIICWTSPTNKNGDWDTYRYRRFDVNVNNRSYRHPIGYSRYINGVLYPLKSNEAIYIEDGIFFIVKKEDICNL
jgi:hypothetical protein